MPPRLLDQAEASIAASEGARLVASQLQSQAGELRRKTDSLQAASDDLERCD